MADVGHRCEVRVIILAGSLELAVISMDILLDDEWVNNCEHGSLTRTWSIGMVSLVSPG